MRRMVRETVPSADLVDRILFTYWSLVSRNQATRYAASWEIVVTWGVFRVRGLGVITPISGSPQFDIFSMALLLMVRTCASESVKDGLNAKGDSLQAVHIKRSIVGGKERKADGVPEFGDSSYLQTITLDRD